MSSHAATHEKTTHPHSQAPPNPTDEQANTKSYASSDPTTHPEAKPTTKLTGDLKGAVHGVAGSLQAAAGTALRNKDMAEKGFEKMNAEDSRLAAKTGKPPVGSETREETVPTQAPEQAQGLHATAPAQGRSEI
ncbi:hypothetical protein A1O3_06726 [Capronia epimyces CBS 606.96]|uniref:Uncharacterized protein n=1 Tax=Capronia epimyces CBS 606.96 TaxID=1182542 RepID=W9XZY2_9EURO|nr:uncharacterized protein A1O3_06726 [Capronia epimyces CBS 606.96]EXJ82910.1 hypothetical protein A1O3_06726 [Capronia epimyces CBS 606.96]